MSQLQNVYNNESIGVLSIGTILSKIKKISYSKALLIMPLVTNNELVNFLKRGKVRSIEELIIKKGICLINFNDKYLELITISINSLTILHEMKIIYLDNGYIYFNENSQFDFNNRSLGKRAKSIEKISSKIVDLLKENEEKLYSQLRVEL